MSNNTRQLRETFDFLSAPDGAAFDASGQTGAIVFGRKDPLVAQAMVEAMNNPKDVLDWAVITGGIGKDSGDLQVPEAEYLAQQAEEYAKGIAAGLKPFFLETQARNGGENVRNSLVVMRRAGLLGPDIETSLVGIVHATSARRLSEMIKHEAQRANVAVGAIGRIPTQYSFDPCNPADEEEAVAEMKRLISWPDKGWLGPQDIPVNLIDFINTQYPDIR